MPPAQNLRGFTERVAVVSDGTNVFGRAIAMQLALQGCYVIVGVDEATIESKRAISELQSIGTLADAVETNVSTKAGASNLFERVAEKYGRLDLLVNISIDEITTSFEDTSEDILTNAFNSNLKSAFLCVQSAAALMEKRPQAAIVNVAGATSQSNPLLAAMQQSIVGFTESLANMLAPKIRVNCVAAGAPSAKENKGEADLLRAPDAIAPNDVAQTVVYLLSSEAEALTGQTIMVGQKRRKF